MLSKSYKILLLKVYGPIASSPPGNLLEIQNCRPYPRPIESSLYFDKILRDFVCIWKSVKYYYKTYFSWKFKLLGSCGWKTETFFFFTGWSSFRIELPLNKKSTCCTLQCQVFRHWLYKKLKKKTFRKPIFGSDFCNNEYHTTHLRCFFPSGSGGYTTDGNTISVLHTRNLIIRAVPGIFCIPLLLKCTPPCFVHFKVGMHLSDDSMS